ncbi:MBL fold metallo-hydrolase [Terrarubrum flagellatum]|uniref:MBL fold metallo-hydrolase n=1 Tax=Terrirubrum flagellatum TaxID=2895980 RepID=UPI0031451C44
MRTLLLRCFPVILALASAVLPARAQNEDRCIGPVAQRSPLLHQAALRMAAVAAGEVLLTYIGHSTFVIETPGGVTIGTDYNDYVRPRVPPMVATMNHAHSTHYTLSPEPEIKHVLRGWAEPGQPADHDLRVGDVRIRNVPTNIRDGYGATEYYGNSIFVFEASGLCVAHLGHLHHTLTPKHLQQLGPIDIVLVPVDGSYTLNVDGMIEALKTIHAPLMIPMHYFGPSTLQRFLDKARAQGWDVERSESPSATLSRAAIPQKPKVLVLPPTGG